MADLIKDGLMIIGSYIGVIALTFGALQFFSVGFLFSWLRVKTSRGKKILVKVKGRTQDYYVAGKIDQGFLSYKDNAKNKRRVKLPRDCLYRSIGVHIVDVDEETNAVLKLNYDSVSGFDAIKFDSLFVRALYKPVVFDGKEKTILMILIALAIGIVVLGFLLVQQGEQITLIADKLGNSLKEVAVN